MNTEINFDAVREQVAAGYITARKHPTADLTIYNYTPKAMWEGRWTPETMACRGLIADGRGEIVARPFGKFFNYEQLDGKIPVEPFEVYEKLDGCLAILYWIGGEPFLTTRGSFTSEQAIEANRVFRARGYDKLNYYKGWTYLFEFISPKFRIVVDYGNREDLVLLAIIDTKIGADMSLPESDYCPFPKVHKYEFDDISSILAIQKDDEEGFVIRFESGFRCKIKFAEYLRLHKILTQCSSKSIWESLRDGKPLDEILERVPDEFYKWVERTRADLLARFACLENAARGVYDARPITDERRIIAEYFKSRFTHPAILFNMLDGKDYSGVIWKILYPKFEKPFREDADIG